MWASRVCPPLETRYLLRRGTLPTAPRHAAIADRNCPPAPAHYPSALPMGWLRRKSRKLRNELLLTPRYRWKAETAKRTLVPCSEARETLENTDSAQKCWGAGGRGACQAPRQGASPCRVPRLRTWEHPRRPQGAMLLSPRLRCGGSCWFRRCPALVRANKTL